MGIIEVASQWAILKITGGVSGKESTYQCRTYKRHGFDPWVRKIPWRKAWQPIPVIFPGESHGQRSLAGFGPWDHKESDPTEWVPTHTHTHSEIPGLKTPRYLSWAAHSLIQ